MRVTVLTKKLHRALQTPVDLSLRMEKLEKDFANLSVGQGREE
jgi:hypothetical protein